MTFMSYANPIHVVSFYVTDSFSIIAHVLWSQKLQVLQHRVHSERVQDQNNSNSNTVM